MRRNFKAGIYSNNRIKYNRYANEKTNNRYIVTQLFDNEFKVTMDKLYKNTDNISNAEMKVLNHRNNNYKITDDDYYDGNYCNDSDYDGDYECDY
jgi:hypothetical protein